jgi:serine/threonine protein kinase/tetratricopeptide (TPR) repeat protein
MLGALGYHCGLYRGTMSTARSTLARLAAAVADRDAVDWDDVEASAESPEELRVIRQLRQLAGLSHASDAQRESWGRLELRGEIGRGTFGTVYRAWDSRLGIDVALKLLNAAPAAPEPSSAIKEGQLLAQVRHPNVVSVYGADCIDGRVSIWMEFVTGRTLKEILREQGPFGAHEACVIGRDLCRALAAVHHKGFLHRDVKAQNVIREAGGRTVLMDFGAGVTQPMPGEVPVLGGTPLYLAPEVLGGHPPTVQTDLYSLGVLLFHLVTGEFPVAGDSVAAIASAHTAGTRRHLRDVRPDLPATFVRVIDAAVSANAAERPQSAGAMEALLDQALMETGRARPSMNWRSLAVGVTVLLALTSASWTWRDRLPWRSSSVASRNSVVILPFRNLTAPEDDYLSEGLTDDLAAHLSTLSDLRVMAGASMRRYQTQGKTEQEIGQELGVAAVLTGSIRRLGDRIRIVSTLVDAKSRTQIWSESFDRDLKDVLTMQAEVARKIAVALKGELTVPDEQHLEAGTSRDVEAFKLYLRGRYYWGLRTEDGLNRAVTYFNDAIAKDPRYALAYAGLSDTYTSLGTYGFVSRLDAFAQAAKAAERAIELDPKLAEAHASLGYAQKNRFEWAEAEASFRRAIELKPNYATAHHFYATLLTQLRRPDEAIAEIKRAVSLEPTSLSFNINMASTLLMARRYDHAIEQFQKVLKFDPGFGAAYKGMATAYMHKGMYDRAAEAHRRAAEVAPLAAEDQELKADIAYLAAVSGRRADALTIVSELSHRYERAGETVAGSIAAIYAGLHDRDAAFLWLERAYRTRDPELGYLKVDPRWDSLSADSRFDSLLRRLKLLD